MLRRSKEKSQIVFMTKRFPALECLSHLNSDEYFLAVKIKGFTAIFFILDFFQADGEITG